MAKYLLNKDFCKYFVLLIPIFVLSLVFLTNVSSRNAYADTVSGRCEKVEGSCKCVCEEGTVAQENCYETPAAARCGGNCTCEKSNGGGSATNGNVDITPPKPKPTVDTPLGPIPTDPVGLTGWILKLGIGLGALLAVVFIIVGGIGVAASAGDPKNLEKAKGQITAAIAGLVFLLCSALILNIIGCGMINIRDASGACPFTL